MRLESVSPTLWPKKRRGFLIICALSALCLPQSTLAQSGRRQVRRDSPAPAVPAEAKTESEVSPKKAKPAPAATLIVGGDRLGSSFLISAGYLDVALAACVERLRGAPSLAVTGGGNMTRKEAVDEAKRQEDAHVVWLEIKPANDGSDDVAIEYWVFIPKTAKVMTSGRIYLGSTARGNGRVGAGVPSVTRRLPLEYQLREGGREVADRVMDKFHVGSPSL